MEPYRHTVQYYETDKMGITHHSNYIRWMEEARIDFLDQIGLSYKLLEAAGVFSPVVSVECSFKAPTTFEDEVAIEVKVEEYKAAKLILGYDMTKIGSDETVCTARSVHCFVDREGKLIALRLRDAATDTLPFMLASGVVMAVTYVATTWIENMIVLLAVRICLASLLYVALMKLCKVKILEECIDFLMQRFRR